MPRLHCCVCGKGTPSAVAQRPALTGASSAPACVDTPGWQNAFAATCASYESAGRCSGVMLGGNWGGWWDVGRERRRGGRLALAYPFGLFLNRTRPRHPPVPPPLFLCRTGAPIPLCTRPALPLVSSSPPPPSTPVLHLPRLHAYTPHPSPAQAAVSFTVRTGRPVSTLGARSCTAARAESGPRARTPTRGRTATAARARGTRRRGTAGMGGWFRDTSIPARQSLGPRGSTAASAARTGPPLRRCRRRRRPGRRRRCVRIRPGGGTRTAWTVPGMRWPGTACARAGFRRSTAA